MNLTLRGASTNYIVLVNIYCPLLKGSPLYESHLALSQGQLVSYSSYLKGSVIIAGDIDLSWLVNREYSDSNNDPNKLIMNIHTTPPKKISLTLH